MTETPVHYDQRAITINGERILLLSGAIHYPRSTPAMWPQLMRQSREAGLNAIETYVFWNLHEPQRDVFDFSEQLDLFRFCQLAQKYGLYVILRIGPYICAETSYGGFPGWLREVPGIQMRTLNEPFLQEVKRWVHAVADYMRPLFAPNGGPIILFQLENEYNNIAKIYGEEGQRYLQWSSDLARDLRLDVPAIMCLGAAPGCLETINSFYAHQAIHEHVTRHPDQPALWTEMWLAWYDTFGYPRKARAAEDCAYAVARFVAAGGTGVNYYMWHGGTNFGRSTMYLQTTSYDCDGAFNEYGCATTKGRQLARLHTFLNHYADLIVAHERPEAIPLGDGQCAYVYRSENRELAFLCNDTSQAVTVNFANQHFHLPTRSVSLFSDGRVLLNTADILPEDTAHEQIEAQAGLIRELRWQEEPLPAQWPQSLRAAQVVAEKPVEALSLTRDTTDYCWYSTTLQISTEQAGAGTLTLQGVADVAYLFVDGSLCATSPLPLLEHRGAIDDVHSAFNQSFTLTLLEGTHDLSILTCSLGLIKGDWMLGDRNMVNERKGLWGDVLWRDEPLSGPWTSVPGLVGERVLPFSETEAAGWHEDAQEAIDHPLRWWQLRFTRPHTDCPLVVDLASMQKGIVWLNGHCIGRYWLVPATEEIIPDWQLPALQVRGQGQPTQRYYFLPNEWLREQNTLVLFAEGGGDPTQISIGAVVMSTGADEHRSLEQARCAR